MSVLRISWVHLFALLLYNTIKLNNIFKLALNEDHFSVIYSLSSELNRGEKTATTPDKHGSHRSFGF